MAPIKFEEQIKQKLEARKIAPSISAWESLEKNLEKDKRINRKRFWYIGLAASIIGLFLASVIFFGSNQENSKSIIVVENDKEKTNTTKIINEEIAGSKLDKAVSDIAEKVENKILDENDEAQSNGILGFSKLEDDKKLANSKESKILEQNSERLYVKPLTKMSEEDLKVIDVVAQIMELENNSGKVTDREIDSLLKRAEKDILKQRIFKETTRTVDANALLQDVEEELDQSFRAKVFDALRSGYERVKTAVADRND
ncbi:MAG: hypothetical protein AAF688_12090 [Bacteroidota bacterium]